MSFQCVRSLFGVSNRLLKYPTAVKNGSSLAQVLSGSRASAQSSRTLTRSMWYLCRQPDTGTQTHTGAVKATGWNKTCGCCGLHTEGDREIAEFLTDEIKLEKSNEKKDLPNIKGFEVTTKKGTNLELTKKLDNETIRVKFNVNNSVDDEAEYKEGEENKNESQMVSRPPFSVEIMKGEGKTLAIHCIFPERYPGDEAQEDYEDLLEIEGIALLEKGQSWDDASYAVLGANMDGNLYDMMLNMLEERGINEDFITELVDFSTTYEHKIYINFLESLQDFVACK